MSIFTGLSLPSEFSQHNMVILIKRERIRERTGGSMGSAGPTGSN
jgi:hypothetical protein